ncbi:MAG TPA: hypothetical protein PLX33_11475 [Alphaproteobacteria bacterium]|nr:hypothetical protein [Alphaproteobacteria bacterium]
MVDTIIAAGILAGFFASLVLALHYGAKSRRLKRRLDDAHKALASLRAQVGHLTAELEKAQRNDTPKDPVTGRFVPRS